MNQNINQKKVMAKYFNKRKLGCFKNFNVEKFVNNFFETLNLDCGTVNNQFIKYVQDKTTKTKSGKVDKVDEILFQNEFREPRIFSIIHTFGHIDHYNIIILA